MRIGIDARYVYDHFPGIGRYVANLVRALSELTHEHTLVLLGNPDLPNTRHDLGALTGQSNVEVVVVKIKPFSLEEQLVLPRLVRRLRLDVLHSPYYVKPYAPLSCPSVVTIYDLIGRRFPKTLSRHGRWLYRLSMGLAVRSARAIITISESAREDIAFAYRLPREHVAVTPLAADRSFTPQTTEVIETVREIYHLPERYVLYLGSNKPHKNLERLIRAWERVTQDNAAQNSWLVIAGHYDPHYPEARNMVLERGLSESVRFIANVAEHDLPALYSGALAFVFPSYYEGFGLPPLEAMACGTPVLCAYASSLPEVVGNAALTFDPYNFIEQAEELRRILHNSALRRTLRAQGLRRAAQFSWQRTAEATLGVYERAARESRRTR
jgi:alpha-1,3-rhamnosyl/mannosyltransferase